MDACSAFSSLTAKIYATFTYMCRTMFHLRIARED